MSSRRRTAFIALSTMPLDEIGQSPTEDKNAEENASVTFYIHDEADRMRWVRMFLNAKSECVTRVCQVTISDPSRWRGEDRRKRK